MLRNKNIIIFIFLLFILLLFNSCYTYTSIGLMQEKNITLPKYESVDYKKYQIKINDEIVYRLITDDETMAKIIPSSTEMSNNNQMYYRVMDDGTIDLPFIKRIPVVGLTIEEATSIIEERFREIIPDAVVKIALNKTFTVIGEISSGVYPIYKEKMNIYQALAMTGDIMKSGDRKHVKIIREKENEVEVLEFDIRPASVIDSEYYYIYPNDIIHVRRAPSAFFKVGDFSSFASLITTTVNLILTVLVYTKTTKS